MYSSCNIYTDKVKHVNKCSEILNMCMGSNISGRNNEQTEVNIGELTAPKLYSYEWNEES